MTAEMERVRLIEMVSVCTVNEKCTCKFCCLNNWLFKTVKVFCQYQKALTPAVALELFLKKQKSILFYFQPKIFLINFKFKTF